MKRVVVSCMACAILLAGLVLAGCGDEPNRDITIENYLNEAGFSPQAPHPLLSLEKVHGSQGSSSGWVSGSWFLFGGSVNGSESSHTEPSTSLSFAISVGKKSVSIIEIPYSKIVFQLDPEATTPEATFEYDEEVLYEDYKKEGLWRVKKENYEKEEVLDELWEMSLPQMIESHLRAVKIKVTPDTFASDIAPVMHGSARTATPPSNQ